MSKKGIKVPRTNIMQRATLLFFDRARTTLTLWAAVLVFGILSYTVFLQRQGFPDIAVPIGVVNAQYFVNNPELVDTDVVQPVNKAILELPSVVSVQSFSRDNFATLVVEYSDEVTSVDGNDQVKSAIEALSLPPTAQIEYRAVNASKINDTYDVLLAVTDTENVELTELRRRAESFVNKINEQKNPLVKRAELIDPLSDGVDPTTGNQVVLTTSFDRLIRKQDGKLVSTNSIAVGIIGAEGVDALALSEEMEALVTTRALYPSDTTYAAISADFAEGIKAQVSTLQGSLLEGFLIILIVGFILISFRAGLVTALGMVTTLLITIGGLYALGMTLNTITLFGLILCLGLIVDDAIIMVEALDAARKSKLSMRDTAAMVTKRVGLASLSGTLTTMLGFAPLLFIGGILGEFIRALPITIIMSLAVSLIVSLTLVPFLAKYLMLGRDYDDTKNPVHNLEKRFSRGLGKLLRIAHRGTKQKVLLMASALAVSTASLLVSGMFFGKLKLDIFPSTKDSDGIVVTATYAPGTTIENVQEQAEKADAVVIDTLGENIKKASYYGAGSARSSALSIDLVSLKKREETSVQMVARLTDALSKLEGASYRVSQLDAGPPRDDYPFKMQIYGDSTNARKLATDIVARLDGVNVTRANGTEAAVVRTNVSSLDTIQRVDNKTFVEVSAGFADSDTTALTTATKEFVETEFNESTLASYSLTKEDVAFDFGNESDNQESFKGVIIAFPILLVVMYVLLLTQFKSITQPLLILAAIPFSLLGVSLGLYYTNNPLSFFVMVALFALIGVAVNNTILLTDYANQARREGSGPIEAIATSIEQRFRPLITTSLTSVIALIPLALSDPFWESLAVTLIFGLMSSTVLVILVYPYYYLLNEWIVRGIKNVYRRVVKTKRA